MLLIYYLDFSLLYIYSTVSNPYFKSARRWERERERVAQAKRELNELKRVGRGEWAGNLNDFQAAGWGLSICFSYIPFSYGFISLGSNSNVRCDTNIDFFV